MKVHVTQEHIRLGKERHNSLCPIARAIKDVSGKMVSVSVGTHHACIGGKYYTLPRDARKFIAEFDDGLPVQPADFTMRAASKY